MKVTFEFAETVTYMHSIDVEIPEEKEEEYEEFAGGWKYGNTQRDKRKNRAENCT